MDCVLFFMMLFFLCVVVFSLSMFALFPSGFASHETLLRHVAKSFGGKYHSGSWFQKGSVTFQYGKVPAYFCLEKADGYYWLRVSVQGTVTSAELELTTDAVPLKIININSVPDIRENPNRQQPAIGDDRLYDLYTNRETNVDLFMTDGVRTELDFLRTTAGGSPLHLSLRRGQLTIIKRWLQGLMQNEMIVEYLYHALRVHDQLQLARAEGIKFVDTSAQMGQVEQLKCAVCGEELGTDFVQCKRCQAPHHEDCWTYNGCCGTYACKETRYVSNGNTQATAWYRRFFKGRDE